MRQFHHHQTAHLAKCCPSAFELILKRTEFQSCWCRQSNLQYGCLNFYRIGCPVAYLSMGCLTYYSAWLKSPFNSPEVHILFHWVSGICRIWPKTADLQETIQFCNRSLERTNLMSVCVQMVPECNLNSCWSKSIECFSLGYKFPFNTLSDRLSNNSHALIP